MLVSGHNSLDCRLISAPIELPHRRYGQVDQPTLPNFCDAIPASATDGTSVLVLWRLCGLAFDNSSRPSPSISVRTKRRAHASCGPRGARKVIDVLRRLSKSALSLQVRAGRGDSIALGIENRDLITVVALVVKYKLVSVIAMCAGCHLDLLHETGAKSQTGYARAAIISLHRLASLIVRPWADFGTQSRPCSSKWSPTLNR